MARSVHKYTDRHTCKILTHEAGQMGVVLASEYCVWVHGNMVYAFRYVSEIPYSTYAVDTISVVGMLACRLDVKINYDIPLTILSALVAIVFTFAAFTTAYISDAIQQTPLFKGLSTWKDSYSSLRSALSTLR